MTIKKGQILNPAGRPKGSANKTSEQIRGFYAMILEQQEEKFLDALNRLYERDPKSYIDTMTKLTNKFLPDIQRTELTGQDGDVLTPIQIVLPGNPNQEQQRLDLSDDERNEIFDVQ